jgi:hypothetical protein
MPQPVRRNRFRACLLTASLVFAPFAFADVFESSALVPPADSVYTVPATCIPQVCLENITIGNFTDIDSNIVGGNQLTTAKVSLMASVFQNVGGTGTPGVFISPIVLNGQMDITYSNKSTLTELGTFSDTITSLGLSGSFNGLTGTHTVAAILNPDEASTGQTTVAQIGVSPDFRISSFFDVFAELSIDHGPFVPGPERTAELTPEPAYYGVIGILLAGTVIRRCLRRTA